MSRTRILHTQDVLTALAEELGGIPTAADSSGDPNVRRSAAR
jgi:hypothetical protein